MRRKRINDDVDIKKRVLSTEQNRTSCCLQFRDQLMVRVKHLIRNSCCVVFCLVFVLIISAFLFAAARESMKPLSFPEFTLEKLKHPLF